MIVECEMCVLRPPWMIRRFPRSRMLLFGDSPYVVFPEARRPARLGFVTNTPQVHKVPIGSLATSVH